MSRIKIRVMGNFQVVDPAGRDVTPRARKSCALLAILALTPEFKRSRSWMQSKLWSDRAPKQAAASLRSALTDVRRSLGDHAEILIADRFSIKLDVERIEVDRGHDHKGGFELLEGLDIRDEEFNDWLRSQRLSLADGQSTDLDGAGPAEPKQRQDVAAPKDRLQLILQPCLTAGNNSDIIVADSLSDVFAKSVTDMMNCEVIDLTDGANHDDAHPGRPIHQAFSVRSCIVSESSDALFHFKVIDESSKVKIGSWQLQQVEGIRFRLDDADALSGVNCCVYKTFQALVRDSSSVHPSTLAAAYCYLGVENIFRLDSGSLAAADDQFKLAFELEPHGVYLAWRAFQRTAVLAERRFDCRQKLHEETIDFINRALELEPSNSVVCGIASHVHTLFGRQYSAAHYFAETGMQLNSANPLATACYGVAESHRGNPQLGFEYTNRARKLARYTPFRYQINALHCIVGTIAGRYDEAIEAAELSHALKPDFAPPLRYLCALYLWRGDLQRSAEAVEKLKKLEPDFGYEMLRDPQYPSGGLQRSELLALLPGRQV